MAAPYNLPDHTRGDTFPDFAIATLTDENDVPIAVTSAKLQVRSRPNGALVTEWDSAAGTITITGSSNVVTLLEKSAAVMAALLPGTHDYDLEIVLTSGLQTLTLFEGTWLIGADFTRTT